MPARKPLYIDPTSHEVTVFLATDYVAVTEGGTGATDASGARTALGVAIGTNVQQWDADLDAVAALAATGFAARTGANTWAQRTITGPGAGISLTNGDGVSGNPTLALADDLAALEGLGSTGIAVRTGASTWAQRSVAGTAGRVSVTNGDGVAGNPTLDLDTLADGGGGALLKFTRDTYGRVSGSSAVTTGDLTTLLNATYLGLGGGTLTNFLTLHADPTSSLHAVTKQYADAISAGQKQKASVRVVATANVTISNPGTSTFDGVSLTSGQSILLTGQSTGAENGPYIFNGSGVAMTRRPDYNTSGEVGGGDTFFVDEGTVYADTNWTLITNGAIVLDTTSLSFTQSDGLAKVTAGAGLTKTGNTLDIGTASTGRIVVNSDNIDLASGIVTPGTYTKITVDTYGRATVGATATPADIGAQPADSDLTALANTASTGLYVVTGVGSSATRTLQAPTAGFTITNPNASAGDPTFVLANDLAGLEGLGGTGFPVRTAADTWAQRSMTGTARVVITNGDGVAGPPTFDLATGIVAPGTYSSVTVDTYGRVTAGGAGAAASSTITSLTNNEAGAITICQVVYTDGSGTVRLARADAAGTKNLTGVVAATSINAAASGNITTAGVHVATTGQWDAVTGQSGGLTPDAYYYLSAATAGSLTTSAPTINWSVRVGKALSTTSMRILPGTPIRLT